MKLPGFFLNVQKSSLYFSANTEDSVRGSIRDLLGMKEMEEDTQYLGLPAFWGKSKKESLEYLKDKILRKTQGWVTKQLNQASKEVLIKSVLQPIPMYTLMCFKLPKLICNCLNSVISDFWWGRSESGRKIHWGAWYKLIEPKSMGGMGFKDFEYFNIALLAQQFWRLMTCPNTLWARVLKGLYFPNKSCLTAVKGPKPSWIWNSLMEGRNLM